MNQQNAEFLLEIHRIAEQRVLKDIEKKLLLKKDFEGLVKLRKIQEENIQDAKVNNSL